MEGDDLGVETVLSMEVKLYSSPVLHSYPVLTCTGASICEILMLSIFSVYYFIHLHHQLETMTELKFQVLNLQIKLRGYLPFLAKIYPQQHQHFFTTV